MGSTPDISSLIDFDFYQPVWHYVQLAEFPEPKHHVARWLGEAHGIRQSMCYWIISSSGISIVHSTIQSICLEQLNLESTQIECRKLAQSIHDKLGYSEEEEKADTYYDYNLHEPQDASNEALPDYLTPACMPIDKEATMPEADDWDSEAFDQHTSSEVILPQGDTEVLGKVIKPVNVITAEIQLVKVAQTLFWTRACMKHNSLMATWLSTL
jgi:hypothetical protein